MAAGLFLLSRMGPDTSVLPSSLVLDDLTDHEQALVAAAGDGRVLDSAGQAIGPS